MSDQFTLKKGKRKTQAPCQGCFLHVERCICSQLKQVESLTRVDLVVHYKELKRTTNSGRLIESLLENQNIWVRGQLDAPLDYKSIVKEVDHTPLLLYPSDEAEVLSKQWVEDNKSEKPFQLIVPDGNWRQASKVHYRVEDFKHIKRVTLSENTFDRENLLRKESKPDGMSTLEAIGHTLGYLEGEGLKAHILEGYSLKKEAVLKGRGSQPKV